MHNDQINTVVIATRHNDHANQISAALNNNKNVFVEKPLAINHHQILEIQKAYTANTSNILMVGFNRRFSPHIVKMKSLLLKKNSPKNIVINVNAGFIESTHWTQDIKIGGGRIIGEACHFIDLLLFLTESKVKSFKALGVNNSDSPCDNVIISILFEDGSLGLVNYFSNGPKNFSKEKIEVFCDGSALCIDNFIKMKGYNWKGFSKMNLLTQNKGNKECVTEFISSIKNSTSSPISYEDIIDGAKLSLDVAESLNK